MKIIVFIKPVPDTRIALQPVESSDGLKPEANVSVLNPDDRRSVDEALRIKSNFPGAHITVVYLGPDSGERFLRDALALGCDNGLRVWDRSLGELHTISKTEIFRRVALILGFDLIFTGTKSTDTANAQLGILLAEALGLPCLTRVARVDAVHATKVQVTRWRDRGYREEVECQRPLVIAMEADKKTDAYASLPAVMRAAEVEIPCLDLGQIGLSLDAVRRMESSMLFGALQPPVPRLQFIPSPDSSLPAFERRRLLEERLTARRRGKIVSGDGDVVAERLFHILLEQGWLKHLCREKESREAK